MRSNPAGGSMVARVIEDKVIKRPEFAGVNSPVSTQGEGGQALARGEGDMAIPGDLRDPALQGDRAGGSSSARACRVD
jgi:hypothetical protein